MRKLHWLLIFTFLLQLSCRRDEIEKPIVKNGVMDLRDWDLGRLGSVELAGDWVFIWNRFVDIDEGIEILNKGGEHIPVPLSWEKQIDPETNENRTPFGFATYFLKILLRPNTEKLALHLIEPNTAAKFIVWDASTKRVLSYSDVGKPADSPDKEIPVMSDEVIPIHITGETEIIIAVQVSNYSYNHAGLWKAPILGTNHHLQAKDINSRSSRSGLIYAILIIAFYHLILFFQRQEDKSTLAFACMCFTFAFRELISFRLLQKFGVGHSVFGFDMLMKIEFISMPLIVIFSGLFIYSVLPTKTFKYFAYICCVGFGARLCLFTLLAPTLVFRPYVQFYQIHIAISILGGLIHILTHLRYKTARLICAAYVVLILGALNDVLYHSGYVDTGNYSPYSFLGFLLVQSSILSGKFSQAFSRSEHGYRQLSKVVYPHQIERIQVGEELETTMKTTPGEGFVISFDIVQSSKILHYKLKDFLASVIYDCSTDLMVGYDPQKMEANGYRIKELGDGFICSIAYPFLAPSGQNPANLAIDLAFTFVSNLEKNVEKFDLGIDVFCGIGIAMGSLQGYYPKVGAKEYDLFGRAIVLATRYEAMRKRLFAKEKNHSIILQNAVYYSLSSEYKDRFTKLKITDRTKVRDDSEASELYYLLKKYDDKLQPISQKPTKLELSS